MNYVILAFTIVCEVIATSLIKRTDGFTNFLPTAGVLICYLLAFFGLSHVMKTIPIGIVYATWSGLGIVLVSLVAYFVYKQALDLPALLGIGFIVVGVLLMNVFSKVSAH